jgi:hypothetical protein
LINEFYYKMRGFRFQLAAIVLGISFNFSFASNHEFDWIKINPSTNVSELNLTLLPEGFSIEMIVSLLTNPYISSNDPITVFQIKGGYYAVLPCRFEVLHWENENWNNLYKGTSSGFNCNPHFFVKDNKIYSVGRYGYWHAHSEILYFDFDSGSWENEIAHRIPSNYGGVGIFYYNNKVFSISGEFIHQSTQIHSTDRNGYYYDFEKQSWFPINLNIKNWTVNSIWGFASFDLKDFGLLVYEYQAEQGLLLINKNDLTLYFSKKDFETFDKYTIAICRGDQLVLMNKKKMVISLNTEEELDQSFQKVGQIELENDWSVSEIQWSMKEGLMLIMGLLTLVSIFIFYRQKFFKKMLDEKIVTKDLEEMAENNLTNEEEVLNVLGKLNSYKGASLEVDVFDEIVGLTSIKNLDYRRVKRSRLIREVNKYMKVKTGRDLIVRIKSSLDKRLMVYHIKE